MTYERLETENVSAYWDEVPLHRSRDVSRCVDARHNHYLLRMGCENGGDYYPSKIPVRGAIYDFTAVTEFSSANLSTVQRESRNINQQYDLSQVPSVFIVSNLYQQRMLHTYFRITKDEERKRIVHSEAEAFAFLDEWHRKRANTAQPENE